MKVALLHCHYAPREARGIPGHKECWDKAEDRTLSQLVEEACPDRQWHQQGWEGRAACSVACPSCGMYVMGDVRWWE